MPKDTSSSSPAKTRQLNNSPSKSQPKKKQAPDHEQDRSQWRPSEIPETATISKTIAMETYHIGQDDLKDLTFKNSQTVRKIRDCGDTPVPMHLYIEREVEMKAWEKHGGPDAFKKMLDEKEKKFNDKHGVQSKLIFPRPRYYLSEAEIPPAVLNGPFPTNLSIPDRETPTPGLISTRDSLVGRGQKWLWDAINKAIQDKWLRGAKRESIVKYAVPTLGKYPQRPSETSSHLDSPSFRAFLTILSRAPVFNPERNDNPGVVVHDDETNEGARSVYWSQSYTHEVYAGLIEVIKEHGLDGWKHARWLVYEKYGECNIGGLTCWKEDRGPGCVWHDAARFWLHGRTVDSDLPDCSRARPSEQYVEYRSQLQKIGAIKEP